MLSSTQISHVLSGPGSDQDPNGAGQPQDVAAVLPSAIRQPERRQNVANFPFIQSRRFAKGCEVPVHRGRQVAERDAAVRRMFVNESIENTKR